MAKAPKAVRLYPVILSGGSGSRLWPLSREEYPKQLQPLTSERTPLQETAGRLEAGDGTVFSLQAPIVVCNEAHRFIVAEQLRAAGIEPRAVVIEPVGRNTAPAACVAALILEDEPDALMLIMPSDHSVRKPDAFRDAIIRAVPLAADGKLVTFGIHAAFASTAYGYIKRGAAISDGAYAVDRFVEKPDGATAAVFLREGGYSWNGGIFLSSVKTFLAELRRTEPGIEPACRAAMTAGKTDLFFFRLNAEAFQTVPSQSIDYGLMERTDKAAVVPVDMGWSDVGSWSALHEESTQDASGNTIIGDVMAIDTSGSYVRSERQLTAVIGIRNVVVVVTDDAVLVADKSQDQQVKQIVERLKTAGRIEATAQARTYRPWGWFQTMDEGARFKVKRICVKPGAQLSLQKHWHRSEHWVIVTGCAVVNRGGEDIVLRENESTFIAAGTVHRLSNPGHVELHMIEVQSGEYVGEDDILRIADDYGRLDAAEPRPSRPALAPEKLVKTVAKAAAKAAVKGKPKRKTASTKPHRRARRKANAAAAAPRRVRRHPMRPSTKITTKATTKRKPGKPKPPGKPPRRR